MRNTLTVIDLFCGAGGLTLGFKQAGFRILLGLDVDPHAIQTYKYNNPEVAWINKDIRKVPVKEVTDVAGVGKEDVDVIIAGIPCEGYSLLNRRYNPSDSRNYLFQEFMRIASALAPRAVLIENVPGLLRRANGSFKQAIVQALEKIGFEVNVFMLNAVDYGVPQYRTRVFFAGMKGSQYAPPEPTHGMPRFSKEGFRKCKPYLTLWDAISDLPKLGPGEAKSEYECEPLTTYQAEMRSGSKRLYNHEAPNHPPWTVKRIAATKPGDPLYKTFKQRKRLRWDKPSPTIPAGGVRPQWFYAHPEQPRGLTVREQARIQSFPDTYVFLGPIIKQRVQVGDAVPPLLARRLAETLAERLKEGE